MPKPARTSCGISYLPVHDTGMDTVRESPLPPSTPSAWLNSLARDVFPRVGNVAVARSTAPMYWRSSPLLAQDADRPADASAHPPFPLARGQGSCSSATRAGPPGIPTPPRRPAQFPAGQGRAHTYARACGVEIPRKKIREAKVRILEGQSLFWLLASGFWRPGGVSPTVGRWDLKLRMPRMGGWDPETRCRGVHGRGVVENRERCSCIPLPTHFGSPWCEDQACRGWLRC